MRENLYPLFKLALPLALTGLIQSSLNFFENIFLARVSEEVLAAGGLVGWLFATLIVIMFGVFSAVNVLVAHKYGEKKYDQISLILRDGLRLALIILIPTFLLFWYISPVLLLFGQSPKLVHLAELYLHALAWGLLPKFILIILFEFVIGLGHSRFIMTVTLISIPLYIFLSYVLIFGKFGFPELGIAGAGWGMTISDWIISILLVIYLFYSKTYSAYLFSVFTREKPSYLSEIIQLGLPMGVMYCIEVGYFLAMTLMMGTISISALASNQITMQYLGPLMGVIFCFAQAITVQMGHQLGAKQIAMAKETAHAGIFLSVIFMLIIAVFYWTMPGVLISVDFDIHNPQYAQTVKLTTQLLYIAAVFQIIECVRISLFGALRALKDTKYSLLTSIVGFWVIALPIGYLLSEYFNLPATGLWYGLLFGSVMNLYLLYKRFKRKIKSYSY